MSRVFALTSLLVALAAAPVGVAAQGVQDVQLGAPRVDASGVTDGEVATIVFPVSNAASDSAQIVPSIQAPAGWRAVMGTASFTLAPGASDTWLVSVLSPDHAVAGDYTIQVALTSRGGTVRDSAVVHVRSRAGLDVVALRVPSWAKAGTHYQAQFLVRNTGNVMDSLALSGRSSRGVRTTLDSVRLALAPGASASVTVDVQMPDSLGHTTTDVLEFFARDRADTALRATTSATVTVIPRTGGLMSGLATIPANLSIRAANGTAGLAPAVLTGSGVLPGTDTHVDFLLQAPASRQGPHGFGEQQQYQLAMTSANYRMRLGDQIYGYSDLTSAGGLGTGAEFERTGGVLNGGGYVQQQRYITDPATEEGAYIGITPLSPISAKTTVSTRDGQFGGRVNAMSIGAQAALPIGVRFQWETAASDSAHVGGSANTFRVSGRNHGIDYTGGYHWSSADFAGPTRGSLYQDGSLSYQPLPNVTLSANASLRVGQWQPLPGYYMSQRMGTTTLTASYADRFTLEYGALSRRDDAGITMVNGMQRGFRATGELPAGPVDLSLTAETGRVSDHLANESHAYSSLQISARTPLGNGRSLSVYGTANHGETLGGVSGMVSGGMDAQIALPYHFTFGVNGSMQHQRIFVTTGASWLGQTDAHLDYQLPDRSVIGLHVRTWASPTATGTDASGTFYLEYRTAVGIPAGPSQVMGRAMGRVVDAGTGAPVVGALVRLGTQAAVSDAQGRVSFASLEPAVYHVALDAAGAAAGAVLTGDVVVDMRHASRQPVDFRVAVARGGEVVVAANQYDFAGGSLGPDADSLMQGAPLSGLLLGLSSASDTIYQTTDDRGRLTFTQVAPGHYTLVVLSDVGAEHHVFESREVSVVVEPSSSQQVLLRLVPQRQVVTIVNGGGINLTMKQQPSQNKQAQQIKQNQQSKQDQQDKQK